jgi:methylated-DNA-[protein]-cysteine S-methyltransferase
MIRYNDYETEIGMIRIAEDNGKICKLDLAKGEPEGWEKRETEILSRAAGELEEYLQGQRRTFDLPLAPQGTDFQKTVWQELIKVPYGTTASYGEIAARIGNPKAGRAVGGAAGRNSILILIPCHRIIGSDGSLTGFGGGLDMKRRLLDIEKQNQSHL